MRRLARIVYKLGDIIELLVMNLGMGLLTFTLGLGLAQIFARKVLGIGWLWAEDIFKYVALWGILLCTGIATRYMTHIKIDFLVRNVKGTFLAVLTWSGLILGLATSLYLTVLSVQFVAYLYELELVTVSGIFPKWAVTAAFVAACGLLDFYYLEQIVQQVYPRQRLGLPPLRIRRGEK